MKIIVSSLGRKRKNTHVQFKKQCFFFVSVGSYTDAVQGHTLRYTVPGLVWIFSKQMLPNSVIHPVSVVSAIIKLIQIALCMKTLLLTFLTQTTPWKERFYRGM